MALEIARREQGGISILELSGRLVFGPEDKLLSDEIREAVAARRVRLVVGLAEVTKIDSAGWGTLLYARSELRSAGGNLALANLPPVHMKVLRVGKLETLFDIHDSEQDAIESFLAAAGHSDLYGPLIASAGSAHHLLHNQRRSA